MPGTDLLIKDGMVVSSRGRYLASIAVEDGRITAIGRDLSALGARRVIDAQGRYVIPGLVDGHTHLGGKFLLEEDFHNETPGAVAGGVTTIGLMFSAARATRDYKEFTEPDDLIPWSRALPVVEELGAKESLVDFFVTPYINTFEQADEIPRLGHEFGLTSFKFYGNLKHPRWDNIGPRWAARIGWALPFDDGLIYHSFEKIASMGEGGMGCIHAENTEIATVIAQRLQAQGRRDPAAWSDRSLPWLEAEHVQRYALLARQAGCRLYIVHLSSAEGLEATKQARSQGTRLAVETCPQYLTMTKHDAPGVLLKVNPPIRDRVHNDALWAGVRDGYVDCLGTDHVVTSLNEKLERGDTAGRDSDPRTDIWATGSGFPGVEYSLAMMATKGVLEERITLERLVGLACEQTAYQWGLYPKKGAIQVGSDADLVIFDLDTRATVTGAAARSRADFSIYEGMELAGWPTYTILRGQVVLDEGEIAAAPGHARYLPRLPNSILHPADMDWRPLAPAAL